MKIVYPASDSVRQALAEDAKTSLLNWELLSLQRELTGIPLILQLCLSL